MFFLDGELKTFVIVSLSSFPIFTCVEFFFLGGGRLINPSDRTDLQTCCHQLSRETPDMELGPISASHPSIYPCRAQPLEKARRTAGAAGAPGAACARQAGIATLGATTGTVGNHK